MSLAGIGKGFGIFYALALVIGCLGIGNMFQSNQAFAQFVVITGGEASFSLTEAGCSGWRWRRSLRGDYWRHTICCRWRRCWCR